MLHIPIASLVLVAMILLQAGQIRAQANDETGQPWSWEIRSSEFAALEVAVAELHRRWPGYATADFDVLLIDKGTEYLFVFVHEDRRTNGLTLRGCGLPEMPAFEIGVTKDSSRLPRATCPK